MSKICPSLLSADFSALGDECRDVLAGGADWDFIDGLAVGFEGNDAFFHMVRI